MGDDKKVELESAFLEYGPLLGSMISNQQTVIALGISQRLGLIYSAQDVLRSVLGSVHSRSDRAFDESQITAKLHRAAIHASVVQGIEGIDRAISTACYVQAAALIRQEIEAVEACEGLRSKRQKEGKTRRLKVLRHLGKHYGVLSSIAHLSRSNFLLSLQRVTETGIDPTFVEGFEKELFCIHLAALVGICLDAAELRPFSEHSFLSEQERAWLASICGLLEQEGYLPRRLV